MHIHEKQNSEQSQETNWLASSNTLQQEKNAMMKIKINDLHCQYLCDVMHTEAEKKKAKSEMHHR